VQSAVAVTICEHSKAEGSVKECSAICRHGRHKLVCKGNAAGSAI
jgi:hypothetical protein